MQLNDTCHTKFVTNVTSCASKNRLSYTRIVQYFTIGRGKTMAKMLTTKDVQNILQVDRSTIYRMVEAGQIPAVRVGKQWRFPAERVENWLHQQSPAPLSAPAANGDRPLNDLASLLPLTCVQLIQDTFAEALGVMLVITDLTGQPITQVSNPCGLFKVIRQTPNALQKCTAGWGEMAQLLDLEPKLTRGHLGLSGARGLVRVGAELKGMVFIGGIAPADWPPGEVELMALAAEFGLQPEALRPHLNEVFYLDQAQQRLILSQVQPIANILAHIVAERAALLSKLETIAKLVTA